MKVRVQAIIDESKLDFVEDCSEIDDMTEEERSDRLQEFEGRCSEDILLDIVAEVVEESE